MSAVSGVRCAQGIARTLCPLRSTPDTAAKALSSRFNRAPPVAARLETKTMNERPNMSAQNDTPISIHEGAELPDDQLRVLAPSVFAAQPIPGVSSRSSRGSQRSRARPGTTRCWSATSCWFATTRRWPRSGCPSRPADGGLSAGATSTVEAATGANGVKGELGKDYRVTRERIRQI